MAKHGVVFIVKQSIHVSQKLAMNTVNLKIIYKTSLFYAFSSAPSLFFAKESQKQTVSC